MFIPINHRDWSDARRLPTKGLCMFKSQQYRAKATELGELVKTSTSPEERREFQKLERRFASLADNEQVLADDHKSAVHVSSPDQSRGAVGNLMSLTQFSVDDGPHNMDGLRLFARDGSEQVEAFIGRKVMDVWADSVEHRGGRQSLFRDQYNALGKLNLAAIQRIVGAKYQRGAAFNRQHPFVDVLFSDITESGEALDLSELVRAPLPPAFHRLT
jgi:hypothetical protein